MSVAFVNSRDLEFQLYEVMHAERLVTRARYADHSRETFDAVLATAHALADAHAPFRHESDEHEPLVRDGLVVTPESVARAVHAMADAGFVAATHDHEYGGMQLPHVIATAALTCLDAVDIATSSYAMLSAGVANLIATFGSTSQRERFIEPLLTGKYFGTMALSEAEAGSSLADVRTLATPTGDGRYCLTGTKMWISGGEHQMSENIVHMVLARIEGAPAGVKGISLFLVPRYVPSNDGERRTNGVRLGGLIHKMGWRGTTSTILNFGEQEPCVGELVGDAHRGLSYMFQMMNEARISVGRAGTALSYAAYSQSLEYARTRKQGRLPGEKDPTLPPVAIIEHADVRRMLLAQKSIVEGALSLILECAYLVDDAHTTTSDTTRAEANALLEVLTPIAKAWPSEAGQEAISLAIQTLGGYGFAREYPIERLYRDNRLNAIHEGTNGVQALDLLGRKVRQDSGAGFKALVRRMRETADASRAHDSLNEASQHLGDAIDRMERVTATLLACTDEPARSLANASVYLDLVSRTTVAWLWLRQGIAATDALAVNANETAFYYGKLHAMKFWFSWELPRTVQLGELLERGDVTPFEMQDAWF